MARIEGLRIQNYKSLKDIRMAWLDNLDRTPLTPITAIIGKNGAGKSTLLDAIGFLSDCINSNLGDAYNRHLGPNSSTTQGGDQPKATIIEILYRENDDSNLLSYFLSIANINGDKLINCEILSAIKPKDNEFLYYPAMIRTPNRVTVPKNIDFNQPIPLISDDIVEEFKKYPVTQKKRSFEDTISDPHQTALSIFGKLSKHPEVASFRRFMADWYLSDINLAATRHLPQSGGQPRLNSDGSNLANVVQFMERAYPERFQEIVKNISSKIPGIQSIKPTVTIDNRVVLSFKESNFLDPFYSSQMSDGTLKLLAYLLMLENPHPPSLLCIDEPENGLYHKFLEDLVFEFRDHANRPGGSQIIMTTHQPYIVDALDPEEVWIMDKGPDGYSTITRASEIPYITNMIAEGQPLGSLWYSNYFDQR